MINTDKTFCTYENIYYEMWEIAGRYTEIAQFQVIGKSHDDRMIPMVQIGKGAETIFCIAGLSGRDQCMPVYLMYMLKEYVKFLCDPESDLSTDAEDAGDSMQRIYL